MKSHAFSANAVDDTTNKRYQLLLHEIGKLIKTNPTLLTQQLAQFKVALPTNPAAADLIKAVSTTIQHNKAFATMVWNDIITMEGGTPQATATTPSIAKSANGMHNAGGTTGGPTGGQGGTGGGNGTGGKNKHHKHHKKPQHSADGGWKNAAGLGDILAFGGDAVADLGKLFGGNNQAAANAGNNSTANQNAANAKNQAAQDAIAAAAAAGSGKKSNTMLYVGIAVVVIIGGIVVMKMVKKGAVAAPAAV